MKRKVVILIAFALSILTILTLSSCEIPGSVIADAFPELPKKTSDEEYKALYDSYLSYTEVYGIDPLDYDELVLAIENEEDDAPYVGKNGNWYIGKTDIGLKSGGDYASCDHILVDEEIEEPTCDKIGIVFWECTKCELSYNTFLKKIDHSYEVIEEIKPTCIEYGSCKKECTVCGDTVTESINTIDHIDVTISVVLPRCEEKGYKLLACSVCKAEQVITIEALGHSYDTNGRCITCGAKDPNQIGAGGSGEWWDDISYEETSIIFQMTHCSNQEELSSGCERYLAGESVDNGEIDKLVDKRNEAAYVNTNVRVTYKYYDDTAAYGLSNCVDTIYRETANPSTGNPDMYCNFMTDMLLASLRGSFANVYSSKRGENYFNIDEYSYMTYLMSSFALSPDKAYVIASDYFIDIIRAFFVVPVNVSLYNTIAKDMIDDLNNDGVCDVNDFFAEVWNKDWTYTRLAQYCARIYKEGDAGVTGASIDDTLGFALGKSDLGAAGLIYTSSVRIINQTWNEDRGCYEYAYPMKNYELYSLFDSIKTLFGSSGVMCVDNSAAASVGAATTNIGVRTQFAKNKLLFGGIVLVGSLEDEAYQNMKDDYGFAIVPVPLYRDNSDDNYLTQMHVLGRVGAISRSTTKFSQCSAFLQYQTEHSTDILNQYYDYNLTYEVAYGLDGNVDMLKYIRANVRTSFDRLLEDSISYFFQDSTTDSRWHVLLCMNDYSVDIRGDYMTYAPAKHERLDDLIKRYEDLPD